MPSTRTSEADNTCFSCSQSKPEFPSITTITSYLRANHNTETHLRQRCARRGPPTRQPKAPAIRRGTRPGHPALSTQADRSARLWRYTGTEAAHCLRASICKMRTAPCPSKRSSPPREIQGGRPRAGEPGVLRDSKARRRPSQTRNALGQFQKAMADYDQTARLIPEFLTSTSVEALPRQKWVYTGKPSPT